MINSIIQIAVGYFLFKYVPGWIRYGDKKIRGNIQLVATIIGIIMLILGAISLVRSFFALF